MNVYVHTDMEGASGIWRRSQVNPECPADYAYGKRCLARDVNAVVAAAFDHGAMRVVVNDGHGPGGLVWDDIDPRAAMEKQGAVKERFVSLADGFDCAFIVGQHAMAGTLRAFLEHTQSSANVFEIRLNGVPHGELGIFAAYAGSFGVPVAMVTGDRACCLESGSMLPQALTVEVKRSLSRESGVHCLPPAEVEKLLRETTAEAMDRVANGQVEPYLLPGPVGVEITYKHVEMADSLEARNPLWERLDGRRLRREVASQRDVYCW